MDVVTLIDFNPEDLPDSYRARVNFSAAGTGANVGGAVMVYSNPAPDQTALDPASGARPSVGLVLHVLQAAKDVLRTAMHSLWNMERQVWTERPEVVEMAKRLGLEKLEMANEAQSRATERRRRAAERERRETAQRLGNGEDGRPGKVTRGTNTGGRGESREEAWW